MNNDDNYETNDLALAAALIEQGHTLASLNSANPRRVLFIFSKSKELENCVADYWQEKLSVNPKRYFDTIRHIKSRIYAG
jgi:hypothetical protein